MSTKRKLDLCPGNARGRRKLRRERIRFKREMHKLAGMVMRVLSSPGIDDYVTTATQLEGIMRRHGASEAVVDVVRERFLKAYPQLKALVQQLKEKK